MEPTRVYLFVRDLEDPENQPAISALQATGGRVQVDVRVSKIYGLESDLPMAKIAGANECWKGQRRIEKLARQL